MTYDEEVKYGSVEKIRPSRYSQFTISILTPLAKKPNKSF